MCLEEVNRTELIIKNIEREIKRMLKDIPRAEYRLSIPGVGPISAAIFLGELGNPS
jgi:transposase